MGENQIQPFGFEGSVNEQDLMPYDEYVASADRRTGNQEGVAKRELINTALRQLSLVCSGIAEFIANRTEDGVLDSSSVEDIENGLIYAINEVALAKDVQIRTSAPLRGGGDIDGGIKLTVDTATTTSVGVVREGVAVEVASGMSIPGVYVSPAGLAGLTSSSSRNGIISIATSAEIKSGLNDTKAVTPKGLKDSGSYVSASDFSGHVNTGGPGIHGATNQNVANSIVARDVNGQFDADFMNGTASTALRLKKFVKINDIPFDGSVDIIVYPPVSIFAAEELPVGTTILGLVPFDLKGRFPPGTRGFLVPSGDVYHVYFTSGNAGQLPGNWVARGSTAKWDEVSEGSRVAYLFQRVV